MCVSDSGSYACGSGKKDAKFLKGRWQGFGGLAKIRKKASVVLPQEGDRRGIRVGLAANIQDGERDSVSGLEKHDWI